MSTPGILYTVMAGMGADVANRICDARLTGKRMAEAATDKPTPPRQWRG